VCVDAPQGLGPGTYTPTCPPFATPLVAKSCTLYFKLVYVISDRLKSFVIVPTTIGEFFTSACGHPLQDLTPLLDCPASEPLRRAIFCTTSSIFDLWSRPWSEARLLGLRGVLSRPHPLERVG